MASAGASGATRTATPLSSRRVSPKRAWDILTPEPSAVRDLVHDGGAERQRHPDHAGEAGIVVDELQMLGPNADGDAAAFRHRLRCRPAR